MPRFGECGPKGWPVNEKPASGSVYAPGRGFLARLKSYPLEFCRCDQKSERAEGRDAAQCVSGEAKANRKQGGNEDCLEWLRKKARCWEHRA